MPKKVGVVIAETHENYEQLLKKIVPVLEDDYKSLTTNSDQRQSFRSHILNAVVNTLTPTKINNQAGEESDLDEEIEINIGDDAEDDKFIDIRTDAEKAAEPEEPEDEFQSFVPKDGQKLNEELDKIVEEKIVDKEKDEELKVNINDIFKSVLEEETDEFRAN